MTGKKSTDAHPHHTVLVVEDSQDSRDALALLLDVEGFRVAKAATATAALEMIEGDGLRPCLVLLDLLLPGMSGLELARHLRASPELASIPIAALSGHEGQRRQADREGVFTVTLLKPTDIDELMSLVGKHCTRAGASCDTNEEEDTGT